MRTHAQILVAKSLMTSGAKAEGLLQRKCACGGTPGPTGECEACKKKRLQRKARGEEFGSHSDYEVPAVVHEVLHSPGQPLDAATRAFFEPRFGRDFSGIQTRTVTPGYPARFAVGAPDDQFERE